MPSFHGNAALKARRLSHRAHFNQSVARLSPFRQSMEAFLFFSKPEIQTDWVHSSWARGAAALVAQGIFDFARFPSG
jgi:hypothetical protein